MYAMQVIIEILLFNRFCLNSVDLPEWMNLASLPFKVNQKSSWKRM